MYGLCLTAVAVLFWIAWLLMPGVGVTDAREIFTLVASQRSLVATSVVLQLVSAMLYAPAMLGVVGDARFGESALTRWGARFSSSAPWDRQPMPCFTFSRMP